MAKLAPLDETITIPELVRDPYMIYKRLRSEAPVLRVKSVGRTMLTKAADTRRVKDTPEIFSSNDPNTPMERAFQAHTLMRKDAEDHTRERDAMAPSYTAKNIKTSWETIYHDVARHHVDRLPRGETVDLFTTLAGPFAADCLRHLLGIPNASVPDMERWSQALIDGAGNFGWADEPFAASDLANAEMNNCFDAMINHHKAEQGQSVLSVMVNADDPIEISQIRSNIKIAIGGGINEPRDALLTIVYGLLSSPEQFDTCKRNGLWADAFEEGVRWVAPIQVSSRLVKEDVEIRDCLVPRGDTVMTIQASACHDEELYDAPELFDIFRKKQPHQAFGNGPHFCQGKHIAKRMLAQILMPMLFDRFPNMELAGPVEFTGFGFRGPAAVPVKLI
jgi:cytochrome P450